MTWQAQEGYLYSSSGGEGVRRSCWLITVAMDGGRLVLVAVEGTHQTQVGPAEWRLDLPRVATTSQYFPSTGSGGGFCRLRVLGPQPADPIVIGASFVAEAVWGSTLFPLLGTSSGENPPVAVTAHTGFERFYITLRPLSPSGTLNRDQFNRLHLLLSFATTATDT